MKFTVHGYNSMYVQELLSPRSIPRLQDQGCGCRGSVRVRDGGYAIIAINGDYLQ